MHPDAPYVIILLCLTPDDFTRQVKSPATQWVKSPRREYLYWAETKRLSEREFVENVF